MYVRFRVNLLQCITYVRLLESPQIAINISVLVIKEGKRVVCAVLII